jgi:hypothetical protein
MRLSKREGTSKGSSILGFKSTRISFILRLAVFGILSISLTACAAETAIVIDHTCTDISEVPDEWLDAARETVRIHFAHESHGRQIVFGLENLEVADPVKYNLAIMKDNEAAFPPQESPAALLIYDGQPPIWIAEATDYWSTPEGLDRTQSVVDILRPEGLTASIFNWCNQVNGWPDPATATEEYVQDYLDSISALEAANPDITFVYMTGNTHNAGDSGYDRFLLNQQIRQYCIENGKVLFDFGDMDAWYGGEQWTYSYDPGTGSIEVPLDHPQNAGDYRGTHASYESCENKAKAFWWLMARLAGWPGVSNGEPPSPATVGIEGPRRLEEGDDLTLAAVVGSMDEITNFQWSKDGEDLVGETGSTYEVSGVTEEDEGVYTVTVTGLVEGEEVEAVDEHYVVVWPVGKVPLVGGSALGFMAGACSLAGAVSLRRRNPSRRMWRARL